MKEKIKKMKNFLKRNYVIISVMGSHANETEKEIFTRKRKEIERTGKSFWLHKSYKAKPSIVQNLCKKALLKRDNPICIFIEASSKKGARPTKKTDKAKKFSIDKTHWKEIPKGILVTGSLKSSFAMTFDKLDIIKKECYLNLWDYSSFLSPGRAIKMILGSSTVCCIRKSSQNDPAKMKSNSRRVVAIGRLVQPFSVWLR